MTSPVLLDLAIALLVLAVVVLGARAGWRTGASRSVLSLAGALAGLVIGLSVSTWLVGEHVSVLLHLLLVAVCAVGGALVGSSLGGAVGGLLGRALSRVHLGVVDRGAGAVVRGFVALVVCSLLAGLSLALAPASSALARSATLTRLADAVPPAQTVVDDVREALPTAAGADLLALVPASSAAAASAPDEAQLRSVAAQVGGSVVRVEAPLCTGGGRYSQGTGFVAAADDGDSFVITNAHVVGQAREVTVEGAKGTSRARVVVADSSADIAVLAVDGATGAALPLASEPAANGTPVVVLGHPEDGPLTATAGVVLQRLPVSTIDDASTGIPSGLREVYRLAADVKHGNSGSPLLTTDGTVVGVVNASGLGTSGTGYALQLDAVRADLATATSSTTSQTTSQTQTSTTGANGGC